MLRDVLERRAAEAPDAVFAVFEDGTEWTHAELLELTRPPPPACRRWA